MSRRVVAIYGIPTGRRCPACGDWLIKKEGRYGFFHGCPRFPLCDYTEPVKLTKPKLLRELEDPNTYNHHSWDVDGLECEDAWNEEEDDHDHE